ncbi:TerB family tellurite resistance protein [Candidatus Oscillochloris fontis]|uniref:TerB family tellurite resistance protein n=1 Tax=Candidatus Oscillochloris fontis TaxID=2496868 RepID=UPI00101DBAC3|nr:TerB family tellurite resistance protein [Candidatus Oscillochloris fontis]
MSDFWGDLGKALGKTQLTLDAARKEAERLAREAGKVAQDVVGEAGRGVNEALGQVQQLVTGDVPMEPVNFAALAEHQRVAYAGALYAMAYADGALDKDELLLIVDLLDLDGLTPASRQVVVSYVLAPPTLADAIAAFSAADDTLRYALLLNLLEVAWANDLLDPAQDQLLTQAQQVLAVGDEQYRAIWRFIREMRAIRLRGQNDNAAAQATKTAAAGLAAVGVPIAIVYVSGSVIGLSAAGITSGLAALGLGLGMVPGIGVAVLLGTGVFLGVRALLDAANQDLVRGQLRQRAQLVLAYLNEMLALLDAQIATLNQSGRSSVQLHERRRALMQIIARRQSMAESLH